jgi:succinoglycan biosynthesis protein ExoM
VSIVNIAICTFKRSALLDACLNSIGGLDLPDGYQCFLTVVDNDEGRSAESVVDAHRQRLSMECTYDVEPKKGIPCARNKAISISLERNADYLIFIDDDETVDSRWLVELLAFSMNNNPSAVVHGQVIPVLPEQTDPSIKALFKVGKRFTGERLSACATDNVLIPSALYKDLALRFDESRPLAGGTDTIFFTQASQRGVEIVQCNEAIVYETIPPIRTTLKWLMKRKYRSGLTDAWRKHQKGKARVRIGLSAFIQFLAAAVNTAVSVALFNKQSRNKGLLKAAKACGVFMGVFGVNVDSY